MDDSIFEDLEKLFEECDDVVKSFNKTIAEEEQQVNDLQTANERIVHSDGDNEVVSEVVTDGKSEESGFNKEECKAAVNESIERDKCKGVIRVEEHNSDVSKKGYENNTAKAVNNCERETLEKDLNVDKVETGTEVPVSNIAKIESDTELLETENKPYVENDLSGISVKESLKNICLKKTQAEEIKDDIIFSEESSKEEGECTATFNEAKSLDSTLFVKVKKNVEPVMNYSSFIDTSKEDGECSTTSFEDNELEITVREAVPPKMTKVCSDTNQIKKGIIEFKPAVIDFEQELNRYKNLRKRKRSISDCNENTPKRQHLLMSDCEDALSPISFAPSSVDKERNILEVADSPLIESKCKIQDTKLNLQDKIVSSSTPLSTMQKGVHVSSTPHAAVSSYKQNMLVKRELLKVIEVSDADSDFHGDDDDTEDKCQTVDELIAEITQLCGECEETLKSENIDDEQVRKGPEKTVSEIQLHEIIGEWKAKNGCEIGTDSEDEDKTLVEDVKEESQTCESDKDNYTVLSAVGSYEKDEDGEEKVGRFKGEVTVSRIEDEKGNENDMMVIDMIVHDANDENELQYADDLLNLDNYDDEGFVDANILEKSHLTKDLSMSVKAIETIENNNNIDRIERGEQPDTLFKLVSSLKKETKDNVDSSGKVDKDVNENVVRGLDYAAFDTSIYRKNENTEFEREICRRWSTHGSADPDINLTVASTKRNKCIKAGKEPESGYLEGDHIVCTYLYEEEILSTFKHYGKTTGQSDLCYMTVKNLLNRLYNQKGILENMNRQSLLEIKQRLQWQLNGTKERQREEMEALQYRQAMEDEHFRFASRNHFNPLEFQCRMMQLRQDHLFQQNQLKEHHQREFSAIQSQGLDILNQEVNRHSVQCEPIGQLIEQLEKPEAYASSSPKKYGPPIVVSLRKGPCKANNGKHSSVPVCLSAGIAQAVSLEDDLYDHYYGY